MDESIDSSISDFLRRRVRIEHEHQQEVNRAVDDAVRAKSFREDVHHRVDAEFCPDDLAFCNAICDLLVDGVKVNDIANSALLYCFL